jgi:very-short-patch-repair endonuclease
MAPEPEERLQGFARNHFGLYRTADAREAGLTQHQITGRVRRGLAERVGKGVYRVAGAPPSREQDVLAAVWRTNGIASHRTAAELHGLLDHGPDRPEVSVNRPGGHDLDGITVHRSSDLGRSTTTQIDGIPVTGVTRTLVDLGQVVGDRALEAAVHRALHRGLIRPEHLDAEYRRLSRRGRPGAGSMGRLLDELNLFDRPAESHLEVVILRIIRSAGLPEPVRQHPVSIDAERFRLDLAYPDQWVFLEGDGFGVHGMRSAFERDRQRQNLLVLAGWRPLRFTWRQATRTPWVVSSQVAGALRFLGS